MSEIGQSTKASSIADDDSDDNSKENIVGCILAVTVIEASDLVAADRGGMSDPYAKISFEKQTRKTKVIKKNLNPIWNESFDFEITETTACVSIELFDHDIFGSHDFLGSVEVPVSCLVVEAVRDEWFELQPRALRDDVVSGRLHLSLLATAKKDENEDVTGLDCFPWMDLDTVRRAAKKREFHSFRVYLASTYVDFVDEFKVLHTEVFPKLQTLCESRGYSFTPVDMRYGMDERTDRTYMYDPTIATICFREIEHCRQISPKVNFVALLGDRYGSSCLPCSLDKNEFMALRSTISDDPMNGTEKLLEDWYVLDENQVPNRFILRSDVQGVAPTCPPGTEKHNEWIKVERALFNALKSKSMKLLASNRQRKYLVSLLEQQVTLGLLLPADASEHGLCIIRGLANLRVVNPQSAKFVDIKSRRCDAFADGIKDIRTDMIDEERRSMLNNLKFKMIADHVNANVLQVRVKEKLSSRCQYVQAQWQGLSVTMNHLTEFSNLAYSLLEEAMLIEMDRFPRYGPTPLFEYIVLGKLSDKLRNISRNASIWHLQQEVYLQHRYATALVEPVLRGRKAATMSEIMVSGCLGGGSLVWQGIMEYLNSRSDGSLKPLLVRGGQGSGVSTILGAVWKCCGYEIDQNASTIPNIVKEGTCFVYRNIGLTAESMSGGMLLAGILSEIKSIYTPSSRNAMSLHVQILEGQELPAADFGGTSDPYVTLSIQNDSGIKTTAKTSVKKRTLNPQWNEIFVLEGIAINDILNISVWDHDIIGSDDLLGRAKVELSLLPLNKKVSMVLPVIMTEEKAKSISGCEILIVQIVEGEDLMPIGQRMILDPFAVVFLDNDPKPFFETACQKDTLKPVWNESVTVPLPEDCTMLLGEVCDGGGTKGAKVVVGRFSCEISKIRVGECIDEWYDLELSNKTAGTKPSDNKEGSVSSKVHQVGRGRIHIVLSKEKSESKDAASISPQDSSLNVDSIPINAELLDDQSRVTLQDDAISGPRLRIEVTLVIAAVRPEEAIGSKPWGGPWTYKELSACFAGNHSFGLTMASASKPLVVIMDGLQNLPSSDLISSLKWLPGMLPRNSYLILGASSDVENRIISSLEKRNPPVKILKISDNVQNGFEMDGFGGEYARKLLVQRMESRRPVANLTENQRLAIISWMGSSCTPLILQIWLQIALITPSHESSIPTPPSSDSTKCIHKSVVYWVDSRVKHLNHGRIDLVQLWKVLDWLALCPLNAGGLSEAELQDLLGGVNHDPVPGFHFGEIMLAIWPLLESRVVGNRLVYCLKHASFRAAVLSRTVVGNASQVDRDLILKELLAFAIRMPEFNVGGHINERKMLLLPPILEEIGNKAELERVLGDLHLMDLRISCGMIWQVLMELRVAGPGASGLLEEFMQLTEEFAPVLDEYPRLLLQIALNMPDSSQIQKQAIALDVRRRSTLFLAHLPYQRGLKLAQDDLKNKGNPRQSLAQTALNKPKKRAAGVEDADLEILPPLAMEWKCARPWIRWDNKPQCRDHCKLVLDSQSSQINCILYGHNGSTLFSAAAHGPMSVWSVVTGEKISSVDVTQVDCKPVTVMSLSPDGDLLITAGEDGKICGWDLSSDDFKEGGILPSKPKYAVQVHSQRISGLNFLSSSTLISCGDDREVRVTDSWTGVERNSLMPFRMQVTSLDCSPPRDGDHGLIATGGLGAVKFWRGDTLDARGSIFTPLRRRITSLKFSPRADDNAAVDNPRMLAVAEWGCDVFLWRQEASQRWSLDSRLVGHTEMVRALAWAPCGRGQGLFWLASGGLDRSVCLWSVDIAPTKNQGNTSRNSESRILQPISIITGHAEGVCCVAFHPQGTLAASSSRDGSVRIWDMNAAAAAARDLAPAARHSSTVVSVSACNGSDSALLASAGMDGKVKVWNLQDCANLLATFDTKHVGAISCVCLTASCRFILTASNDGTIKRWDLAVAYTCTGQVKAHRGGVARLLAHQTGEFVLSVGGTDGRVTVWDVASMQDAVVLQGEPGRQILQAVFASDGKMVIVADATSVRLWNLDLGRELLVRPLGDGCAWDHVDFSGDGRYVVTAVAQSAIDNSSARPLESSGLCLVVWDASKGLRRQGELTVAEGNECKVIATAISCDAR